MKIKKKIPHTTVTRARRPKQVTKTNWKNKYKFYNHKGIPDAALDDLAEHMVEWVNSDPNIMVFGEFLIKYAVSRNSMRRFLERSDKLRDAKSYAMHVIGVNREKAALFKKIDYNTMKLKQHQYDSDWGEAEERASRLRSKHSAEALSKDDLKQVVESILKPVSVD